MIGRVDISGGATGGYYERLYYVKDHPPKRRRASPPEAGKSDAESSYDYGACPDRKASADRIGRARYYNNKLGVWLSADPLAEKYPGWNPYNYTLNNPIIFYDPDGKDIKLHTSARNSKQFNYALNLYLKTELGKQQYNEMKNNNNILVVLAVGDFEKTNANTASGSTSWLIGSQAANSITYGNKDMGITDETFENKGKQVIIVKISKDALEYRSRLFNAETIYHELYAHIALNIAIGDYYGYKIDPQKAHTKYGSDGSKTPKKGSPASDFIKQAMKVENETK